MAKFIDATGREWPVAITVGTLRRLKSAGVDIDKIVNIFADPFQFAATLWLIVSPIANGVTEEQFAESLDGSAIESAGVAVLEAYLDFTLPSASKMAAEKLRAMMTTEKNKLNKMVSEYSPGATESPGV